MPKKRFRHIHRIKFALLAFLIICGAAVDISAQAILAGDRSIPVEAKNGMVVTNHTLATQVALEVLKNGGNAISSPRPCR